MCMCVYMYICVCVCESVCVHIYVYVYHGKWQELFHGAVEEHEKELLWQLRGVSKSVKGEEG